MRFPIPIVSVVAAVALAGCAEAPSPTGATSDEASAVLRKGGVEKVVVCHVPPGNPDNAHEITVGAPAVPAHLAHGDEVGECGGDDDDGDGDCGEDCPV